MSRKATSNSDKVIMKNNAINNSNSNSAILFYSILFKVIMRANFKIAAKW